MSGHGRRSAGGLRSWTMAVLLERRARDSGGCLEKSATRRRSIRRTIFGREEKSPFEPFQRAKKARDGRTDTPTPRPLRTFVTGNSNHANHTNHSNHTVLTRRLQDYLRWRDGNARHPDVLAAQRRERARIGSERRQRWGHPRPGETAWPTRRRYAVVTWPLGCAVVSGRRNRGLSD